MIGESAARGKTVSESVHVVRVPALPDDQESAIAFRRDGSVIIYMLEEHITAIGAAALEGVLSAGRIEYDRQWGHPLTMAA